MEVMTCIRCDAGVGMYVLWFSWRITLSSQYTHTHTHISSHYIPLCISHQGPQLLLIMLVTRRPSCFRFGWDSGGRGGGTL